MVGAGRSKVHGVQMMSSYNNAGGMNAYGMGSMNNMQSLGQASNMMRAKHSVNRAGATKMQATMSEPEVTHLTEQIKYPTDLAPRGDDKDTFGDQVVHDPYRWLENPDSAETKAWVDK